MEIKFYRVLQSLSINGNEEVCELLRKNITFTKQVGSQLIWQSVAEGEEKKVLINNWKLILSTIKKHYGEVKVQNLPGETEEERAFLVRAIELFSPKTIQMNR